MLIKQLSVFVENQKGKLWEITDILRKGEVDIRALTIADTTDFGILRLIVSDPAKAEYSLKEQGFTVSLTDVIAVQVDDRPGALAAVLDVLNQADISVEYMYAFVSKAEDAACVILRVDDNARALEVLKQNGVRLVSTAY
ncbi:MAG: amino acid-binding domain protein [Oscillospiraceae bacterium]|nr:amino acid-binding domain protein [Oscillospiraceae bacterium]